MTVARILESKGVNVVSAPSTRTISEISSLLADRKIGAVVIVGAEGRIQGIISERDVVRAIAQKGAAALADSAAQHMTRDVITCSRQDRIDHVMEEMTRGRFRHMPVEEDGRLIGIVSIGDVVKMRIAETEAESRSLRDYIQMAT